MVRLLHWFADTTVPYSAFISRRLCNIRSHSSNPCQPTFAGDHRAHAIYRDESVEGNVTHRICYNRQSDRYHPKTAIQRLVVGSLDAVATLQ